MLLIHNFFGLLSRQYLLQFFVPDHGWYPIVTSESDRLNMEQSLRSKCLQSVAQFLSKGILPVQDNATALEACRFEIVYSSMDSLDANRLLRVTLFSICRSEGLLPRYYRTTLSQISADSWRIISTVWASQHLVATLQCWRTEDILPIFLSVRLYSTRDLQSLVRFLWGGFLSSHPFFDSPPHLSWPQRHKQHESLS